MTIFQLLNGTKEILINKVKNYLIDQCPYDNSLSLYPFDKKDSETNQKDWEEEKWKYISHFIFN